MKIPSYLATRCSQIADSVVPLSGDLEAWGKRWQAAWEGARLAFGYDPDYDACVESILEAPQEVTSSLGLKLKNAQGGDMSEGWPAIKGAVAYDMYVFANCAPSIPHGTYVFMDHDGIGPPKGDYLRVHPDHIQQLQADFKAAGSPKGVESVCRRGCLNKAPRWW